MQIVPWKLIQEFVSSVPLKSLMTFSSSSVSVVNLCRLQASRSQTFKFPKCKREESVPRVVERGHAGF